MTESSHRPAVRRRSTLSAVSASLLASLAACSGASGPIDGQLAHGHVQKFVAIGPRPFGSDNLAKTADYICAEIEKVGLKAERQEILHEKEKKTIRNLFTRIDGPDPEKGPILMLGAHYDTKLAAGHDDPAHNFPFVGAIDGGGAPAVLIELARVLKSRQQDLTVNVWCYWIDAEESLDWNWSDDRALLGSKAFCEWLVAQKVKSRVKAFVLLDLIGDKNLKIDKDGASDPRLLDLALEAATAMGQQQRMYEFPTAQEVAYCMQKGIKWGTKDDHNVFQNYGITSVLLIDFARRLPGKDQIADPRYTQWWHTAEDDIHNVSPESLAFAGNLVMQMLPGLSDFCLGKKK